MPKSNPERLPTSCHLPHRIIDQLDRIAADRRCSRNTVIVELLTDGLKRRRPPRA